MVSTSDPGVIPIVPHMPGQLLLDNNIILEHNSRFIPSVQAAYEVTN